MARFAYVAAAVGAILSTLLGLRVVDLKARVTELLEDSMRVSIGSYLPSIPALQPEHRVEGLHDADSARVFRAIAILSADCDLSMETVPSWRELHERTHQSLAQPVVWIGVTRDTVTGVDSTSLRDALGFTVVPLRDAKDRYFLRTGLTPQTLLVGPDDRVVAAHVGVLRNETDVARILEQFTRAIGALSPPNVPNEEVEWN